MRIGFANAALGLVSGLMILGCTTPKETTPSSRAEIRKGAAVLVIDSSVGGVESSEEALRRRVLTHAITLASPAHVRSALGRPAITQTKWFAQTDNPDERTAWLMEHLTVESIPGTALIQLDLIGVTDRLERATILQELVESYFDRLKRERTTLLLEETKELNTRKIAADLRWTDVRKEIRDKRLKISLDGGGETGIKAGELALLIREQVEAQLAAGRAYAEYTAASETVSNGNRPAGVEEAVSADPRLRRLRDQLDDVQSELDAALVNANEQHPTVIAARRKVDAIAARVKRAKDELLAEATARRLAELNEAKTVQMSRLEGISKRVDNLKLDIGELSNSQAQLRLLEDEELHARQQIIDLQQELRQIQARMSSSQLVDLRWYQRPD